MSATLAEPTRPEAAASAKTAANPPEFTPATTPVDWPDWFLASQTEAWKEFLACKTPTRKDEPWRFSNIKGLDLAPYHCAEAAGAAADVLVAQSCGVASPAAKFVLVNNQLVASDRAGLPEGVVAMPLEQAAVEQPELFRRYFMSQPVELGSHKYALLHRSQLRTGVFLYVPEGIEIERPVEVFYWVDGAHAAVFPHTLVVCAANSRATVIDYFRGSDASPALACGVNDLHADAGSRLQYYAVQNWSTASLAFHLNSTIVGKDATATSLALNLGGAFVRGESLSRMVAEGARSEMLSINPVEDTRMIDQRTLQQHDAPGATSDLLYHNTLDGASRTIFAGLIKVAEGAHRTDAYQKVRNVLLSDEAEANSMPGLEILADEVRCTHGATSGEVSEDELFYMQARGIPKQVGRRMVIMGFFDSLLERIGDAALRQHFSDRVRAHLDLL